jgi:hypothetical protein
MNTSRELDGKRDTSEHCPSAARQRLEEYWRQKVDDASSRYRNASSNYRQILDRQGAAADREALIRARQEETQALAEYTRVLKIFTDLTIHGIMPGEAAASSAGQ